MAVSIITPQQQEAGIDKFLRRAGSVAGLAKGGLDAYQGFTDFQDKQQALADQKAGVRLAKDIDMAQFQQAAEGDAGAEAFKIRDGDNVITRMYKKRAAEAKAVNPLEQDKLRAEIKKIEAETGRANREASPDGKKYAQNEYQAAGFATRAKQAQAAFDDLLKTGYNPSGFLESLAQSKLNPEFTTPENAKLFRQSKDDFISAVLRKESGAAIADSERAAEERKYFPMPGDSDKVKEQKAASRAAALATLESEAGGALGRVNNRLAEDRSLRALIKGGDKYKNMSGGSEPSIGARGVPQKSYRDMSDAELQKAYEEKIKGKKAK